MNEQTKALKGVRQEKLIPEICRLVKEHPFYSLLVLLVCVLAYGFFAAQYTYHIDSLESSYYDSFVLIGAGRFVAPLVHLATNWMAFSPFWQTVMYCILLVIAGLIYAALIKRESGNAVSDRVLFVFIMAFVSSPLMVGQLTYPNISIALSFLLVPLSLWFTDPFGTLSFRRSAIGVLLLTAAVDMYEVFAPVYLLTLFFILFLRFFCNVDADKNGRQYRTFLFRRVGFMLAFFICALILDFGLSKIICRIGTGSFDYWYGGNTSSNWVETSSSVITSLKKLFCFLVIDLVLTPAEHFWAFLYDASLLFLGVVTIVIAVKRAKKNGVLKTVVGIVCFLAMFASTKALDLILCKPAEVRMLQPILLFTSFSALIFVFYADRSRGRLKRYAGFVFAGLVILLQTQTINNFAVKNQERFYYEDAVLTSICGDLTAMDVRNKPVCFYAPDDYRLPSAFRYTPSANPIARLYRETVYSAWDELIPTSFMDFLNRHFPWKGEFLTAEDCMRLRNTDTEAESAYLGDIAGWEGRYTLPENTFRRKGLTVDIVPQDKEKLKAYYRQTVFEKGEKYRILEDDDLITVILITPVD